MVTESQQDVWSTASEYRDMADLLIFAHKCVMTTSASWNTLPGAIHSYELPSKQAKFLGLSTITFVASLRFWKLRWLPKEHLDATDDRGRQRSKVDKKSGNNTMCEANGWKIGPASLFNTSREGTASADGEDQGRLKGRKSRKQRESKQKIKDAELEDEDLLYTSPGDTEGLKATEVSRSLHQYPLPAICDHFLQLESQVYCCEVNRPTPLSWHYIAI